MNKWTLKKRLFDIGLGIAVYNGHNILRNSEMMLQISEAYNNLMIIWSDKYKCLKIIIEKC